MPRRRSAFERCEAGEPAVAFGEIYIQTGYDPSPAPEGKHLLSVFGQYAPYDIAAVDWDAARDGVAEQFIDLISRFAPDFPSASRERGARAAGHRVANRPHRRQHLPGRGDSRTRCGGRLAARTPVEGLYMCGAATHPAGSVIALNGRNAASAVLADQGASVAAA